MIWRVAASVNTVISVDKCACARVCVCACVCMCVCVCARARVCTVAAAAAAGTYEAGKATMAPAAVVAVAARPK